MANGSSTTRWVIGVCLTAVLAISGWAVTATLAARLKMADKMEEQVAEMQNFGNENRQRIMVLESQFSNINDRLVEIKTLISRHMERDQ
jgi:hypothetical protein